ncbi:MAG: TonB family protein [Deltaproteobacteria bacterium]|nr:TonB family protein [Deltaproteobacteria bacterium]
MPASGGAGFVSLNRVPLRTEPKAAGAIVALLPRGSEVELGSVEESFTRAVAKGGRSGWLEAGTFETAPEREARERRTKAVADFAPIEGRIVVPCPIYLAPDFGAARWGELEEGDPVEVVLAEHDFLGVRLLGIPLAFVPAHAVRYLAPPRPTPAVPERAPVESQARPVPGGGETSAAAAGEASETEADSPEPYPALPVGAEPPVLKTRVEPHYPSLARKAGIEGEVVLQVVVERDGTIGSVFAVQEASMGLTAAATDAVRRWVYTPARLDGRPIAVVKTVRVRFTLAAP